MYCVLVNANCTTFIWRVNQFTFCKQHLFWFAKSKCRAKNVLFNLSNQTFGTERSVYTWIRNKNKIVIYLRTKCCMIIYDVAKL